MLNVRLSLDLMTLLFSNLDTTLSVRNSSVNSAACHRIAAQDP